MDENKKDTVMDRDDGGYEKYCSICHRPESQTGKMIELPGGMFVCPDCMQQAFQALNTSGFSYADLMDASKMENMMKLFDQFGIPGVTVEVRQATPEEAARLQKSAGAAQTSEPEENESHEAAETAAAGSTEAGKADTEGNEPEEAGQAEVTKPASQNARQESHQQQSFHIPGISMINLSDLMGMMTGQQQIKKKKPKEGEPKKVFDIRSIPAPHKIKASLDDYVIGQEHAKKVISVAVYNHYKRIAADNSDGVEIEKSNMLMLGPTGCGKTYLVKTLARLLDVPLAIADATSLTEAGYIGDDIESVISRLLAAADNDVERAEQGIVFIDEIDKIAKKKNATQRDVSGESVQQGMLKLLEGSDVEVPVGASSKNAMVPMTTVNTRNILFICGGAFPGLDEIIKERLNRQASIGFMADLKDKYDEDPDLLSKVTVDDIRSFGMIPEFIGRLPIIFTLRGLTKESLVKILKEPKNAIIKQYKKLLALDEVDLTFDDGALEAIAERALEKKTGARALRAILEEFMLDIMYEIPKDDNIGSVEITREYIEHTGGPVISLRQSAPALLEKKENRENKETKETKSFDKSNAAIDSD